VSSSKGSTAGGRSSGYVRVPGGGPSGEPPVKPASAPAAQPAAAVDAQAVSRAERAIRELHARLDRAESGAVEGLASSVDRLTAGLSAREVVELGKKLGLSGKSAREVRNTILDQATRRAVSASQTSRIGEKPATKPATKATRSATARGTAERGARAKEIRAGKAVRTEAVAHLKSVLGRTASLSPGQIESAVGSLRKLSVSDLKYVQKRFLGLNIGGSSKKQMLHWIAKKIHDVQESRERVKGIEKMNM
jgi:hypothetical protein